MLILVPFPMASHRWPLKRVLHIGLLNRWSVEPLILWAVDPLNRWSVDLLIRWSVDPLIRWSVDPLTRWSVDLLIRWLADPLTLWPFDPPTRWSKDQWFCYAMDRKRTTFNGFPTGSETLIISLVQQWTTFNVLYTNELQKGRLLTFLYQRITKKDNF